MAYDDLPSAAGVANGHILYLEDAKIPVIASNGTWMGLDGRTISSFITHPLFGWGWSLRGNLGVGTTTTIISPTRETCSATDWCQLSVGRTYQTHAIKTNGQLWTWGGNNCGQLGDGTTTNKCSPVREFCCAADWCQVGAGRWHTSAVKTSGELWVWGWGTAGRLGDGTTVCKCSPVREISSSTDWCALGAGCFHSIAIKSSGELWTWGSNICGTLGDGTTVNKCSPVREFYSATDWCAAAADGHSVAIKTTGQLWSWGYNTCGELGDGTTISKCSPVQEICSATDWCRASAGWTHTAAIKTSGQIWTWGGNTCGELGDGTTVTKCSPVREICSATDWSDVSAGTNRFSAAIKSTGQIWAWGNNSNGQLGDGTFTTKCSPVREISSSTNWDSIATGDQITIGIKLQ